MRQQFTWPLGLPAGLGEHRPCSPAGLAAGQAAHRERAASSRQQAPHKVFTAKEQAYSRHIIGTPLPVVMRMMCRRGALEVGRCEARMSSSSIEDGCRDKGGLSGCVGVVGFCRCGWGGVGGGRWGGCTKDERGASASLQAAPAQGAAEQATQASSALGQACSARQAGGAAAGRTWPPSCCRMCAAASSGSRLHHEEGPGPGCEPSHSCLAADPLPHRHAACHARAAGACAWVLPSPHPTPLDSAAKQPQQGQESAEATPQPPATSRNQGRGLLAHLSTPTTSTTSFSFTSWSSYTCGEPERHGAAAS